MKILIFLGSPKVSSMDQLLKSDEKAIVLRQTGNMILGQGMHHLALLSFNRSLCFATSQQNLALTYANRSAVYLQLKLRQQSLNNIRLAREHGYPNAPKLDYRQAKCLELLPQVPPLSSFEHVQLSGRQNEKFPFVINEVEVQTDEQFGRKVIATAPLKVGDIVSIEAPFLQVLTSSVDTENPHEENAYKYCQHCLNNNLLDLIPCAGCNVTMFCNSDCEMQARGYHQYECAIALWLVACGQHEVAIRTFFRALAIMDGSMEQLQELFKECQASPHRTVFDFDFSNPDDPEYKKNQLRVAFSLAHDRKITEFEFPDDIYKTHLEMLGLMTPQNKQFILEILLHIQQTQLSSSGHIGRLSLDLEEQEIVGSGHYLFGSLVNHSCVRNVIQLAVEDKMCLIVVKPIDKEEQLFDSYSDSFYRAPVADRQRQLEKFSFVCHCEACENPDRYTTGDQFKPDDEELYETALEAVQQDYSKLGRQEILDAVQELKLTCQSMFSSELFPNAEFGVMSMAFIRGFTAFIRSHAAFKFQSPKFTNDS